MPFDRVDLALALAGEGGRFVRQHFHFGHVGGEEGHVVADEALQPLARLGVAARRERLLRTGEYPEKAALLDTEQQLLLASHVVVHAGERHVGRRSQVAHRGGVVALVGEDLRRPGQEMVEPLVVGAHGFERSFELLTYRLGSIGATSTILHNLHQP